jgi:hypothetical protein
MSDFSEQLSLPKQQLENLADAYRGYAQALAKTSEGEANPIFVASSYAISAVYRLIIDPSGALGTFREAALAYQKLNNQAWMIYAICADDLELLQADYQNKPTRPTETGDFYALLARFYLKVSIQQEKIGRHVNQVYFEDNFYGLIDQMNIPYKLVVQVINDSHKWGDENRKPDTRGFSELVRRFNETLEIKQSDSFHWDNQMGNILPLEPVSIAISVVLVKRWMQAYSSDELFERLDIDGSQRIILQIVSELVGGESGYQRMF